MENSPVSLKGLIYSAIFAFAIVTFVILKPHIFSKTFLVICDIGQGDALYIRQADGVDILIDTGPDESILECLGQSMHFSDKHIDMVFISHPHLDHYGGLSYIFKHYKIGTVYVSPLSTKSTMYSNILTTVKDRSTLIFLTEGTSIAIGDEGRMDTLWPSESFFKRNSYSSSTENVRFSSINPNDFSLVQLYTYKDADILLTGDISHEILQRILNQYNIHSTDILKVPHHGSDTGLTDDIFKTFIPDVAVISVGKKNRYNHPSQKIIEMLDRHHVSTMLTTISGSITFDYKNGDWVLRQSCFLVFSC